MENPILFTNPAGTRFLQAIGSDWKALIGANGVVRIDPAAVSQLERESKPLVIRLDDRELDQLQIKTPG